MNRHIGLTPNQLQEVTGYKHTKNQLRALALMEIPFKVRPDGTPFVTRTSIDASTEEAEVMLEAKLTLI
jgi:hypothetical protein